MLRECREFWYCIGGLKYPLIIMKAWRVEFRGRTDNVHRSSTTVLSAVVSVIDSE